MSKTTTKDFHFKQFSIFSGQNGMAVSTDGVLLGAWANCNHDDHIIDVGTGSGLLALMCAQRFTNTQIKAIDIEPNAIQAAQYNVDQSPWLDRIEVSQQDALSFQDSIKFDHLICNPPYFTNGATAALTTRAMARHCQAFDHQLFIKQLPHYLTAHGRASFILPVTEGTTFIELAAQNGWQLSRYWQIQTTPNKPVTRLLFEITRQDIDIIDKNKLIIHQNQGYSDGFIALTKHFYLKM